MYVFHNKYYIPTIGKFSFQLSHVRILGSMECGNTRNDSFQVNSVKNNIRLNKDYYEKLSKTTGIDIQSHHWGGKRQLSMEVIAVEYYPN